MNKIIGIIGLTLVLSACGGSNEEHKETTTTSSSTIQTEQHVSNSENQQMEKSIKRIDAIDKELQEREADLDKALKDLEGL